MESLQTRIPLPACLREIDNPNMPTDEREKYQRSLDAYRTNAATYAWERAEGRREGRAEGLEEGRAEGRAEGRREGRAETLIDTARNLKRLGIPTETISQATKLSHDEIETL